MPATLVPPPQTGHASREPRPPDAPHVAADGHVADPRVLDGAAARRALRAQIARLERRVAAAEERLPGRRHHGPFVPTLAELERARDDLVARVRAAEGVASERAAAHAAARARVEAMLADPAAHPWERVTREQLGERGCGEYRVRPRAGLLGMLAGWWEVKLSSGCPLCRPPR